MYLLDTDVLIALLRPSPAPRLVARLAAVPREQQFTSSISLGELVYGARKRGSEPDLLIKRLDERVAPNLEALPFDASAAWHYGAIRADLERVGNRIGDADIRIAAIGRARGLTVITREHARVRSRLRIAGRELAARVIGAALDRE